MVGIKALILAGGFGTRLRPLSCTRPKLMFPIACKPLLEWTLERLENCSVVEVILAVNYMADVFEKSYGSSRKGVKISYSREKKPLGTGGPLKEAEEHLIEGGSSEPFFVLNGDILSYIDYTSLYQSHLNFGAELTIALHHVDDPSRYGVVEIDSDGRVLRFVEKPPIGSEPSNMINAGVYVINPTVLEYIPRGEKISLERQIFPKLAESGVLYGYVFEDMWVDIGVPDDYLRANKMVLEQETKETSSIEINAKVHPKAKTIPPITVCKGVVIGKDASVGPYVSLGEGTYIGRGVKLENSILFNEVFVDDFSLIKGAIIGQGALLGKKTKVEEGCILGDHVTLNDNVTLSSGVQICHNKEVNKSILEKRIVM